MRKPMIHSALPQGVMGDREIAEELGRISEHFESTDTLMDFIDDGGKEYFTIASTPLGELICEIAVTECDGESAYLMVTYSMGNEEKIAVEHEFNIHNQAELDAIAEELFI